MKVFEAALEGGCKYNDCQFYAYLGHLGFYFLTLAIHSTTLTNSYDRTTQQYLKLRYAAYGNVGKATSVFRYPLSTFRGIVC